jgi:hypothetical protein
MSLPSDSLDSPREGRALVAASLLFIAIGLIVLALLLLDYATQRAARVLIGASPRGDALPEAELSLLMLGLFVLAWVASCASWLHARASEAHSEPARTIAIATLLGAAIPVLIAFGMSVQGAAGSSRGYHLFDAIVGGMLMVTPVAISKIAMYAARAHCRGGELSWVRILWTAQVRSMFPAIIAGVIIGVLNIDRGRHPTSFELTLDIILPLSIGVWSYWQGFQTLRAAACLFRSAPSPNSGAKP